MRDSPLTTLARVVSILGHPLLVLPGAGLIAWMARNGVGTPAWVILIGGVLSALLIQGYATWRVHSGAWRHVDASEPGERRQLNHLLLLVFVIATGVGFGLRWPQAVTLSLLLSAMMVAAAALTARWCKASLHMAFAIFAAGLLYSLSAWACATGLLAALAIAWSRLHLRRHGRADLWCGAVIGAVAAVAFWVASPG